jgi:predicted DNA-binding protein (UPF0251 family)
MVNLYRASPRPDWNQNPPHCQVSVTLNETKLFDIQNINPEGFEIMRLVFNTTLTVDVASHDDELRKAFMELVTHSARTIYGPASMLAKSRVTIAITETSRDGMVDIDLFDETPSE